MAVAVMPRPAIASEPAPCQCGHPARQHARTAEGRQACIAAIHLGRVGGSVQQVKFGSMDTVCPCPDFAPAKDAEADPAVEVMFLVDAQNRPWTKLAPSFVPFAGLCSATKTYREGQRAFRVRCCQRSEWAHGETGYCRLHFQQRIVL